MLTLTNERPKPRKKLSQKELESLFGDICNKSNWKEPVRALIRSERFNDYNEACIHFTGGGLDIIDQDTDMLLVESEGYYHHIGS